MGAPHRFGLWRVLDQLEHRQTTDPAVVARFSPTMNASGSTIAGSRGLDACRQEASHPRSTLRPPVSMCLLAKRIHQRNIGRRLPLG